MRLTDQDLIWVGTEVTVYKWEHLNVYKGEPDRKRPLSEWYLDDEPPSPAPHGYVAIRQRHTCCLAYIKEEHTQDTGVVVPQ